jgi:DNA-binding HxlR family transcriptional regulator
MGGIVGEAPGTPKIEYKITMGSRDRLLVIEEDDEEEPRPFSELRRSFEQLHVQNAPSSKAPELPSGQSRVAALAAQLEASKIIFRPMVPTVRPKPMRDTLDDEEEEGLYERNLGRPRPCGYGVSGKAAISHMSRRKQEVPPKPPQKNYVYALHDFAGTEQGDLPFRKGDKVELLVGSGQARVVEWWSGRLRGAVGLFPSNYVRTL